MTLRSSLIGLLAFALCFGCTPERLPQPLVPGRVNPVLDADFPDPAVLRASDGFYYAYATQTERDGKWLNIQVARSADLMKWEHLGDALPAKPGWASKTQDFWAPHVHQADGRYFLYYSAKPDVALTDDKRGLCLAVATARSPIGPFVDMGKPLQCGDSFVNIDPMAFDDPQTGKRLLYWGSGFRSPSKVQERSSDRISFEAGTEPVDLLPTINSDDPDEYQKLVEGASGYPPRWLVLPLLFGRQLLRPEGSLCGPRCALSLSDGAVRECAGQGHFGKVCQMECAWSQFRGDG